MDWLDQYLQELDKPVSTRYLPPDSHTWNKPNPTNQQKSLIQDSVIADMVRMRLVQEARQAEIEAGMGGSYDAGSKATAEGPTVVSENNGDSGLYLFAMLI